MAQYPLPQSFSCRSLLQLGLRGKTRTLATLGPNNQTNIRQNKCFSLFTKSSMMWQHEEMISQYSPPTTLMISQYSPPTTLIIPSCLTSAGSRGQSHTLPIHYLTNKEEHLFLPYLCVVVWGAVTASPKDIGMRDSLLRPSWGRLRQEKDCGRGYCATNFSCFP